jgi:RimJ/RimL family protein N-acetyltransferase
MNSSLNLKPVGISDSKFLYELLMERKLYMNISHKKMPNYDDHVQFIRSKPYTKWYIITKNHKKLGSIYLSKQGEIGIFLKKEIQKKGIGVKAMEEIMKLNPQKRYLANINPNNKNSICFFKKLGFNLIQYTFEKEN